MGENKLLLPLGGKTILERSLSALLHARIDETIVVLGYEAQRLRPVLAPYPVRVVENKEYARGMSRSLQAGLAAVSEEAAAVLVALADQPCIGSDAINRLIETYRQTGRKIVAPSFNGRRGNPVLLDMAFKAAIMQLTGDVGCREILRAHPEAVVLVPMATDETLRDLDRREDYERLLRHPRAD